MTNSVHTNTSAAIALQNLTRTNERLGDVQSRISTGLKVQGAKDNAAIWAIAQQQRADVGALSAVKQSLDRATSIADVALSAGESVSDLLNQLKEKVVAAKDSSLKTQSRELLNADFQALLKAIASAVDNATFDGGNILNGSLTTGIQFLANADASAFVTLTAKDLSLGGAIIELSLSDSLLTLTGANFQGTPVSLPMDMAGAAITMVCVLSERRLNRLTNPALSVGLPAFLTKGAGMFSGMMLSQYTADTLITEQRILSA
ncbi:MAG: aromatic amino acid lyase, partial [Brevundimonas sp.]